METQKQITLSPARVCAPNSRWGVLFERSDFVERRTLILLVTFAAGAMTGRCQELVAALMQNAGMSGGGESFQFGLAPLEDADIFQKPFQTIAVE
jgi:hypothetical protein